MVASESGRARDRPVGDIKGHYATKLRHSLVSSFSTDEASRIKPSGKPYMVNRYPLIELAMSRRDCQAWLAERGYPEPPKSACIGCPYRSDAAWIAMRESESGEFADAVAFEKAISGGLDGMNKPGVNIHRSLVPLDQVQFKPVANLPLYDEECAGICGV
jgi:hypothetical protein